MEERELDFDGVMRLIEGILLEVLDKSSISGKWYPRDISLKTLKQKKATLHEMYSWLRSDKWDIWLGIYCDHFTRNSRTIKKNYLKIRRKSMIYVNKRIKTKKLELANDKNTETKGDSVRETTSIGTKGT